MKACSSHVRDFPDVEALLDELYEMYGKNLEILGITQDPRGEFNIFYKIGGVKK